MTSWPPLPSTLDGLSCPPFGIGFCRTSTDHEYGVTSSGIPYQGFDYTSTLYNKYAGVVTMRLSMCLPSFFVSLPENPRPGIMGIQVPNQSGLLVVAESLEYGRAVLDGSLVDIVGFARLRALDLAIDGSSLTAIQVPLEEEELHAYCEDLALVAASISANRELARFVVPATPTGFYGYPGSVYVDRDDGLLANLPVAQQGHSHEVRDILALPPRNGVQAVAFRHHYLVTTSTGKSVSTQAHDDHYVSVPLPFRFRRFGFDWHGFGDPLMMFAPDFEDTHQISADDNRFGGDVARPMLAWLDSMSPPRFGVLDQTMWFWLAASPTPQIVEWCASFAGEFFEHIQPAVWQGLGYPGNPLARDLR